VDPWSYTENGQAVPVTKVKIHLKGTGRAILNAFYNGVWNQVLLVPARDASNSYGVVANPDRVIELDVPGATAFRWTIAYTKGYNSANGIKAGLTVMETSVGRPDVVCGTCHTVFDRHLGAHEEDLAAFCGGSECHDGNLVTEHKTTRGLTCRTCHESKQSVVAAAIREGDGSCNACHNADSRSHPHGPSMIGSSAASFEAQCRDCHDADLVTEHARQGRSSGDDPCSACHLAQDAAIQSAIASGWTSCEACHGADAQHPSEHASDLADECLRCHEPTLSTDHDLSDGCNACHKATRAKTAWLFRSRECGACHKVAHQQSFAASLPPDIYFDPRFEWSRPMQLSAFAGESWVPAEAVECSGSIVLSGRAPISISEAWWPYFSGMSTNAWSTAANGPEPEDTFYSGFWWRGVQRCQIILHSGASHSSTQDSGSGTRAEIIWWGPE
jgi:hypothetical protein